MLSPSESVHKLVQQLSYIFNFFCFWLEVIYAEPDSLIFLRFEDTGWSWLCLCGFKKVVCVYVVDKHPFKYVIYGPTQQGKE